MKLRVHQTSGPAFQSIKNGKPYNRWVGTVTFTIEAPHGWGVFYYKVIDSTSKEKVEKELDSYQFNKTYDLDESELAPATRYKRVSHEI